MSYEKKKTGRIACLFLTALIWGAAFVAQSEGNVMGPFTFNGLRNLLGFFALLPFIRFYYGNFHVDTATLRGGISCGLCLFLASNTQQIALLYTTPGKTGFITACYMIFVPIAGIFMGRRIGLKTGVAVLASALGLYLLCIPSGQSLSGVKRHPTVEDNVTIYANTIFLVHKNFFNLNHAIKRSSGVLLISDSYVPDCKLDIP